MPLPTHRLLILLLFAAVLVAFTDRASLAWWLAGGWLVVVLALVLSDWRLTPRPEEWAVNRAHDERLSLATSNQITVTLRLRRGLRPVPVWVRDVTPASFRIADESRVLAVTVEPHLPVTLHYDLWPPRRGRYDFGDLYLRWESSLGLFRRQARYPAAETVKVYPNLVDVRKYDLLLRKNRLWELGVRRTRLRGAGSEFERLRDYQPDDEFRRIHWPATARRGRPISIEYETERSQNILALLDIGRVMRSPVGDVAKMDYAINAVLLLAYVATGKGDRVGMLTFAERVESYLAPRSGKGQFQRMLESLYAVQGAAVEPDYNAAFAYLARQKARRSLVVVFTDLTGNPTEALVTGLIRLRRQHLPLLVTIADPTVTHLARLPVTDSTSLYDRTVAETVLAERRLARFGVLTLDVAADELSVAVINRYLAWRQGGGQ